MSKFISGFSPQLVPLRRHFNQPFQESKPQTCQFSHLSGLNCFVDRLSKKTCTPFTFGHMWHVFCLHYCFDRKERLQNSQYISDWEFERFFSMKLVIKNTIWFAKTKISERSEIEKWTAPSIFWNKKMLKICVQIEQNRIFNILNYWREHLSFMTR